MTEQPYSNREIDARFDTLEHRLFDEEEGYLPRIERQGIFTNGKVKKIIIALVLVFGILIGQNMNTHDIIANLLGNLVP
ncbi:hypothetical protein [Bradyrhizobium sp. ORS 285]|uniref:hypothetical protein n=1 Tax=Bradyrhizobium sp. ORS 285 TaxID=115808 RepID=UPI00055565DC|nr:hypothetical protein [Bradyrhizobium sp. ORS 285]